jgi:DNA-binding response OmpR family regulator
MSPTTPPSALVVEPDPSIRLRTVTALTAAGFHVISTDAFEAARHHIVTEPPLLLVTALKLGEYNGLHLVLRAKTASLRTASVVTADRGAEGFRGEVEAVGATYVVAPVGVSELVAAVFRTLFRPDYAVPVSPPFERRQGERRTGAAEYEPNRRSLERRRDLATLMQLAGSG